MELVAGLASICLLLDAVPKLDKNPIPNSAYAELAIGGILMVFVLIYLLIEARRD